MVRPATTHPAARTLGRALALWLGGTAPARSPASLPDGFGFSWPTGDVDRPMAALVKDLERLGMLKDTLVVWGAEFGRTPLRQGMDGTGKSTRPGRDHHKDAFCCWLAGGGIKGGVSHGKTDELGFSPAENPVHVHDLNATLLHLLGLDHEKLTFEYQGREFRLTDVHGKVVKGLLS